MIKSSKLENQFALEVKIQMYLCHPNIVKLFGIVNEKEHIYLILEHMEGGSLYEHLKNKGKLLTEKQVAYIIKEMVSAIRCLHDLSIAHRDIKPENIMISNVNLYLLRVCVSQEILDGQQYVMSEEGQIVALLITMPLKFLKAKSMTSLLIFGALEC